MVFFIEGISTKKLYAFIFCLYVPISSLDNIYGGVKVVKHLIMYVSSATCFSFRIHILFLSVNVRNQILTPKKQPELQLCLF